MKEQTWKKTEIIRGNIRKMQVDLHKTVVYHLPVGNCLIPMNRLIGKKIHFKFLGQIHCVHCGKRTKTSFFQGYCYSCFTSLPQTDSGVLRPELDLSYLGISRNMAWSKKNSLCPHYVYLACSGNLKVGVTRESQIPTRWIDQGASRAIKLAKTPNRHIAGIIENGLKKHFSDKTNWREMLKNKDFQGIDLEKEKNEAKSRVHPELQQYFLHNNEICKIAYPLETAPKTITGISFDKTKEFEGTLKGIKGQYLVFEEGKVINIRKHNAYFMELKSDFQESIQAENHA